MSDSVLSIDRDTLNERSRLFRYVYFLISSFSLKSMDQWSRDGEPNPFVQSRPRSRQTHQQEIMDIFEDTLRQR